ncbi:MAG TPA: HisA/HisF-related TIM barrel protein, partial [Actinomycetota bacterium]|nr:HisA/HisF-related TIM barrel protein [Actinomycetota bacterium]
MPFEVIPALDVAGGRLVHVIRSGQVAASRFGADPLAAAHAFVDAGATRLHVVDVDLARSGAIANGDVLGAVSALGVPVQASGGVRTDEQVDALLARGAERVVLGSAALRDRERVGELVGGFGDRLVVGVEADGRTVRPR